jgi:hypothetical protein
VVVVELIHRLPSIEVEEVISGEGLETGTDSFAPVLVFSRRTELIFRRSNILFWRLNEVMVWRRVTTA